MIRIVAGTYEGLLYGWQFPTNVEANAAVPPKIKLIFGYAAHIECIKSVALMAAKNGKTLVQFLIIVLTGAVYCMIYNVDKRVEVGNLMEQKGSITCLEFFGNTHMLSGSADNSICIWRTSDWNCLHILGGHKGEINSIAVHPSGKLAFSVARDRTLRMWNLVKGRIAYIRRLEKEASLVVMSQTGARYALVFGSDVSVFSANAELSASLEHKQRINAAVFANDDYVVCGGEDKHLYVWKVTGELVAKVTHADITARIRSIEVVYPRGKKSLPFIVLATSNGTVQIWDLAELTFDDSAPVEANASAMPVATTMLLSKARLTCLSVCMSNAIGEEAVEEETAAEQPKPKKKKKAAKPASAAATAAAPRVVVELDDDASKKNSQKHNDAASNAGKKSKNNKKRKGAPADSNQQKNKQHKAQKQQKQQKRKP
ncbi:TPA: hypothetical protein N0F65_009643 [Lagenidium giganteum]|uniref:P21-activated protein kinase-interacting protein 1-like n=1 Tax=Lagenidium giganteum TaxID=4803 RepID=A0AAV2YK45_9STRA|nr:TPA: hypothetical protein N0F65_009643 [Lagenidium giganteum]